MATHFESFSLCICSVQCWNSFTLFARLGTYFWSSYVYLNFVWRKWVRENWYPAIIGSKAVVVSTSKRPCWSLIFFKCLNYIDRFTASLHVMFNVPIIFKYLLLGRGILLCFMNNYEYCLPKQNSNVKLRLIASPFHCGRVNNHRKLPGWREYEYECDDYV